MAPSWDGLMWTAWTSSSDPFRRSFMGCEKLRGKTQKSHEQWEFMAFLKVIMMIISMCKMYLRIYGRWQQALVGQVSWLEGCEVELRRLEARRLLPGSRLPFSPCCRLAGALRFVYPVPMAGKPGTSKVPWCLDVDVGLPRYHQVTAHPGRSINVHIWYGATAATAQRWEHEKVLESRAIRKDNGTADWNVMEVESDEKSSIEHHTPQILKTYHHTCGIAPHWRRTDNLEVLASCQVRDKLWAGGCSCNEFFIPWGLSRNG